MSKSNRAKQKWKAFCERVSYFFRLWGEVGFRGAWGRSTTYLRRRYGAKAGRFLPTAETLAAQRAANTDAFPLISVVVPLFNTPDAYLKALLSSMQGQTCKKWQLVLLDVSDTTTNIAATVSALADERIVYTTDKNEGIALNTNKAVKLATGEYIGLLDHDDLLAPHAIYEMASAIAETGSRFLYSDEALFNQDYKKPIVGHFKPDFAPEYLRACNYICHFAVLQKALYEELGGERKECDGSQDHDLFLRASEKETPRHIAKVLYYWRVHDGSTSGGTAAKPYVRNASIKAVDDQLQRLGVQGNTVEGRFPSTYKVNYEIIGNPLVSILIPNMDHTKDLDTCITSICEKTDYTNYEILVIENNSKEAITTAYYNQLPKRYPACRVVKYGDKFNFSAINNFGRTHARGEYLVLMNNDTEVINEGWLREMLMLAQQPQVGAVGAMLYYPDETIQHAGVIIGLGGYAGHSHKYAPRGTSGYMFRAATVQDLSAATAACLMVKTEAYDAVQGLDESFAVAYNDVDFCLRLRAAGWRVLWTPYAELYHYESKSRGLDLHGAAKARFEAEHELMDARYGDALKHDVFYNRNLTLDREDFSESDVLLNDR